MDSPALAEANAGVRRMYRRIAAANGLALFTMALGVGIAFGLHWQTIGLIVLVAGELAVIGFVGYAFYEGEKWRKKRNRLLRQP